jgi:hypothetical protein
MDVLRIAENDGAGKLVRRYISLEIVMAHVSVTSIPAHTFDAAIGEILTRIVVFAGALTIW